MEVSEDVIYEKAVVKTDNDEWATIYLGKSNKSWEKLGLW